MMCYMRVLALVALLAAVTSTSIAVAQAAPYSPEKNWEQVCKTATALPLTAPSFSGPLGAEVLPKCDESAMYYGFGEKPNYAAALQCGWYQRAHPQPSLANMFYGPGVLTMLYANGLGVPRNYDLATRFACENPWTAQTELEYRIGHLKYLRSKNVQTQNFDLCDDITSGLNQGACEGIAARAADARRGPKIAAIVQSLPPTAKSIFPDLQAAESAFEKTRVENEIDLTGTGRGAFQLADQTKLRDQFLINLERFGRRDVPPSSQAQVAELDRQLNLVYRQIMQADASAWEYGTVKPEGIRETQRKWLKLGDAWANFARVAYPKLSGDSIRAQLIRLRLHQLRALLPRS